MLEQHDYDDLNLFAEHHRGLFTCILAMLRFVKQHENKLSTLDKKTQTVIKTLLSDGKNNENTSKTTVSKLQKMLIKEFDFTGEKALVKQLRDAWKTLLS